MMSRAWMVRRGFYSFSSICGALMLLSCEQPSETPQDAGNLPTSTLPVVTDGALPEATAKESEDAGPPAIDSGALDATVSANDAQADAPTSSGVTYQKQIRAVMETSCLDCHTKGGIGPIPFDDWKNVEGAATLIAGQVAAGIMPPSGWNRDCRSLNEDRSLTPDQLALFAQWKQAGFPQGNPADYVAPPPRAKKELGEPTIVMSMGVQYTPPASADEYRCFVLDEIEDETYLTGMQILPGQVDEVHHVIIHRVEGAQVAQVHSLDEADAKPGYLCRGGAGATAQNLFSYRPGSEAVTFDKGDAAYIAPGSTLVIQVHYNTVFLDGKKPTPDETKIALWTLPKGQLPERVVYRTTTFGPINIAPNAKNVISNISQPMRTLSALGKTLGNSGTFVPGEVIGMTPHAHQLATKMNASLKRASGESACLDDVKWDFQWQLDYMFKNGVPYTADDTFTASCTFDNSPENQPVIDGVKQTSKAVVFGERSTDEMCEHYIWLRFAREAFLEAR